MQHPPPLLIHQSLGKSCKHDPPSPPLQPPLISSHPYFYPSTPLLNYCFKIRKWESNENFVSKRIKCYVSGEVSQWGAADIEMGGKGRNIEQKYN